MQYSSCFLESRTIELNGEIMQLRRKGGLSMISYQSMNTHNSPEYTVDSSQRAPGA